ncbi:uncharacterized protein TRIVIDRAFT_202324 [Trichoderma virens Gv29-8]|uniref:Uncharacterized protein n=1 Tax=Hypocrea virens (strain Gv29-8 / FGSC 10586) TaxID=413071 RepID=G9MWY5_HYPVG|nr:uncharacterized protein TRIVIDRAFT_202324 [Trichoderma virens Gv29-8]EHK21117.1 hypothetical protein TRIVIDRAFT_202324 [Trichoderma virens Gv29-8]UKZ49190.1 hypothetical protein TrVGV298_003433 [Trichoderma virens]
MPKVEDGGHPSWPAESESDGGVGQFDIDITNVTLCQVCRVSVCWQDMKMCVGCASGAPRPLPSKFLRQLRDDLARTDSTVVLRWLDGRGRIVHRGKVERAAACGDKSHMADMCETLSMYALKNGWAAWALDIAKDELRGKAVEKGLVSGYKRSRPIEDDAGPITHWCSCGNQKLETSGQSQSLSIEVAAGALAKRTKSAKPQKPSTLTRQAGISKKQAKATKKQPIVSTRQLRSSTKLLEASAAQAQAQAQAAAAAAANAPPKQEAVRSRVPTKDQIELAYERGMWSGVTPQIFADALWLAGTGLRQIEKASGKSSKEVAKGARGSVETMVLHYYFMNNHINTLADALDLTVLGAYLTALDHGNVRDSDFTPYTGDVARHASLARWTVAMMELAVQWPTMLDWHAGSLSSLGLVRGLELRAWVFAAHWDVLMHYELASSLEWEERLPSWLYVASALGHDVGDLCTDTRMGCIDNAYFAVGGTAGYEGVAACMDIVCDALEAVVLRDTRGAIDVCAVSGSACATFERAGGNLCACSNEASSSSCEVHSVLASICGDRRITADDAAYFVGLRDAIRSRCQELPRFRSRDMAHLNHADREKVYAQGLVAIATGGSGAKQAHARLQVAYSSAAQSLCGQLRRMAADLRQRIGHDALNLSNDCMCGGECTRAGG